MGAAGRFQNGVKHQPTRGAVGEEFSPGQAKETDRLYDELMSTASAPRTIQEPRAA